MKINEVEAAVGVTKKNIRFYEEEGLITPSREPGNGYRSYSQADVERLRRIKLLRKLDVPLAEIREMLEERNLERDIEVDGGIYQSNVAQVLEAGANVIVSGSGVYGGDIRKNVEGFMEILKKYE